MSLEATTKTRAVKATAGPPQTPATAYGKPPRTLPQTVVSKAIQLGGPLSAQGPLHALPPILNSVQPLWKQPLVPTSTEHNLLRTVTITHSRTLPIPTVFGLKQKPLPMLEKLL